MIIIFYMQSIMKRLTDISDIKQLLEDCLKEFANNDFDLIGLGRELVISCKLYFSFFAITFLAVISSDGLSRSMLGTK